MEKAPQKSFSISTGTIIKLLVAGLLAFWFWQAYDILIAIVTAVVLAAFVERFVVFGEKFHIPRFVSVILFFILAFLILGGVLYLFIPVLISEINIIGSSYPELLSAINSSGGLGTFSQYGSDFSSLVKSFGESFSYEEVIGWVSILFGGALNFFLLMAVTVYLSLQEGGIDALLRLIIPEQHEKYAIGLWKRVQRKIGGWFQGQLLIALLVFVLTSLGLLLAQVPYALLLGIVAGLFSLIPYGIVVALVPTVFIGFTSNGWAGGIWVILIYGLVQVILDYLIQPLIVRRVAGVPPLLVIIALIIGAKLFGFFGLIIGIPITVLILELIGDYERHREEMQAGQNK